MKKFLAEFFGTAGLLTAVVGSGIMAERLAQGNVAIALLANVFAIAGALLALILTFGPVSGAHLNPVVSLSAAISRYSSWKTMLGYMTAQLGGAVVGVMTANLMFDLPAIFVSTKVRSGFGQWLGEFIATFGLVGVIISTARSHKPLPVALAVSGYIAGACWFTSSTSFANPAVTIARSLSDTFTGIRPADTAAFLIAEVAGGIAGAFLFSWLTKRDEE